MLLWNKTLKRRVEKRTSELTKINDKLLLSENKFIGISKNLPSIMIADGPHGLRKEKEEGKNIAMAESFPATCFPTSSCLASTWNRNLIYQVGLD